MNKFLICIALISCGLVGCATNPVTGKQDFALMSEAEEIKQGRRYHQQILLSYGIYPDSELQQYVDRIGQELAAKSHRAHLDFTFTVLDSPEINAFALPGGYIYITRGIMAYLDSEAELAGVLGHEIGHVTARHSVRQQAGQFASDLFGVLIGATTGSTELTDLSRAVGTGVVRGYGREHELEADRLGAEYLHNTGYDPETMLEVIGVLKDQEVYERALAKRENRQPNIYHGVYSTHPRNDDRLQTVVRAARKLSAQDYRDHNRDGYHAEINGLAWGPSVSQGVVRDNRFAHPKLAFTIDLPAGWRVINRPEFLQAQDTRTGAVVQLGLETRKEKESLDNFVRRLTGKSDLSVEESASGVSAKTRIRLKSGGDQPARVSAIGLDDRQVLTLLGTASSKHFGNSDNRFREVNQSFTRLSPSEAGAITGPRLQIIERRTQTFSALAGDSAIDYEAESILRLLNRSFPDGDIGKRDRLKTVIFDD